MSRRMLYDDIPDELRSLIAELQQNGDYLVIENEQRRPVACITPLSDIAEAQRDKAARKLRELLDSFPTTSPYSEEETYQHIDEAIAAIRAEGASKAVS